MTQMIFDDYVKVIKKNDVLMVKKLWNDNFIKMKTADRWRDTILLEAVRSDNLEIVKFILSKGVNVNECNFYGDSPLHKAERNNNDKIVSALIEHGADVNLCNIYGISPLYKAERNNNDKIVSALIEHGADINLCDKIGDSPLHRAARNNNDKIVSILIEHGADINLRNINGKTPLQIAEMEGHLKCASVLKKFARTPLRKVTSAKIDVVSLPEVGHEETCTFEEEVESLNEMNITKQEKETLFDIFISYCHDDETVVMKIYNHLKKQNYKIWIDKTEIHGGEILIDQIMNGIENSKVFLASISAAYQNSENCRNEFNYAKKENKLITPVCVQNYKPMRWIKFLINETMQIRYPKDGKKENFDKYLMDIEKSVKTSINNTNQNK